jgi:CDP-diacylglycerol--serine O-phosphatidyltransferase
MMRENKTNDPRKPAWRRGVKFVRSRRPSLAVLPTMLTLGNGTCGLAAIAVAVSDTLLWPEEQKLMVAGLLIFGGMLCDAFDGQVARMTNQSSEFGAQLDSLCDAITFGTAPAVIVWRYSEVLPHRLAWTIGVLFALCVLLRLARFNAEMKEDDTHEGFDGLPSPAAAGTIASFAIAVPHFSTLQDPQYAEWIQSWAKFGLQASHYLMPTLAVVLAYLMVSRVPYPHVFQQLLGGRRSPHQIGKAIFAIVGLVLLHELVLPIAFCYFAFAPPIRLLLGKSSPHQGSSSDDEPEELASDDIDLPISSDSGAVNRF